MGLTKNNYYSKNTGVTLPTAYAILKDLVLNGNRARAIFVIQSSRENTTLLKPIDKVEIYFDWDRKSDLVKMAYEKAKTQKLEVIDGELIIEKYGMLYGWYDDIVE